MKIGILTVPFNNNYGGFLQAYALKKVLTTLGHDVIFIIRKRDKSTWRILLKRFIWKCITPHRIILFRTIKSKKLSKYTNEFVINYLFPFTKPFFNSRDLYNEISQYKIDCYIVGSDQVWRYAYAKNSIKDYFFDFLKNDNIPRFSYAASFGTSVDEYPDELKVDCSILLNKFISLSVREDSAIELLTNVFKIDLPIQAVLDPTLLLSPTIYLNLAKKSAKRFPQEYLFCYILDMTKEKENCLSAIAQEYNIEIVSFNAQSASLLEKKPIRPVEEWLASIYEAKCVLTDSYHGMIFSIIFNKPFLVFGNINRGIERFTSILNKLGLTERLISNNYSKDISRLNIPIAWDSVNARVERMRLNSIKYISDTLKLIEK